MKVTKIDWRVGVTRVHVGTKYERNPMFRSRVMLPTTKRDGQTDGRDGRTYGRTDGRDGRS